MKKGAPSIVALIIVGAVVLLLVGYLTRAQVASPPLTQTAPDPIQPKATRIEIVSIGGKVVGASGGAVLETLYENEGLDVVLSAYAVGDSEDVWLLVKPKDARVYIVFGPAKRQEQLDGDTYIIPDVVLPNPGAAQRKHFLFRGAVTSYGQRPGNTVTSLESFTAVSSPALPVAVLKWVPASDKLTIDVIDGQSVDGQTVEMQGELQGELTVSASADVVGTQPKDSNAKPYLILHPVNSKVWRVVGPAEVRNGSWYCRDVPFSEPGQPHWRYVDVFAFQSSEPLQPGPIPYTAYVEKVISSSYSVRVYVKDEVTPPPSKVPKVTFTRWINSKGEAENLTDNQTTFGSNDTEFSLQGEIEGLTQGKALWVVINPLDTSHWIVQEGPALVSGNKWTVPRVRLEAPADSPATRFRLFAVVSDSELPVGIVDFTTWQNRSVPVSPILIVERKETAASLPSSDTTLSITRVAGVEVDSGNEVSLFSSGPVEVQVDELSQGAQIWIGKTEADKDAWIFVPAIRSSEDLWIVPNMVFGNDARSSGGGAASAKSGVESLVAIMTKTSFPVNQGGFAWWRHYAWKISPLVNVVHVPTATSASETASSSATVDSRNQILKREGDSMPTWGWIIITLLVLVVLAALEYGFRVVSMAAGEVRRSSMAVKLYLESQVQEMPKPRAVPSVLGLLILALGVVAIVGYFPIYQHVLRSALRLNPQQSHSLAFLLIIFIGLSGVLADITSRFGRRSEAEEPAPASSAIPTRASHAVRLGRDYVERGRDGHSGTFVYMLLMSLLALIALSLLMFQGILYLEFYQSRAAEGSRIPFAFGAAALFIAGIEMLNFYWATRLALDFIAWLFVQVLLLAPPLLVSQAALITERAFLSLPSRVKSKVQEESPQTELSSKSSLSEVGIPKVKEAVLEDDARRIANVFIITKLGDHLCAETPKHTDNGWRARVTNKLSGKVEGELEIDRDTGAVEWLPSMEEERHAIERSAQTIPDG